MADLQPLLPPEGDVEPEGFETWARAASERVDAATPDGAPPENTLIGRLAGAVAGLTPAQVRALLDVLTEAQISAALDGKADDPHGHAHFADTANPHGVTAGQANAEPAGTVNAHAGQADVHHDPANDPAAGEKAALAGTEGVPGAGNPYVTDADPRNTDSREPNAHDLGGAAHGADTLANLNAKVSDATLDDASDPRDPTAHALGGPAHSADTLANLNAKVSDATLDGASDPRTPTEHGNEAHDPDFATAAAQAAHEGDTDNPHEVTAGQVGAAAAGHDHDSAYEPTGAVDAHAGEDDAHHSPANDPSAAQKAALAGTEGTPGDGNRYVTDEDPRNSDDRDPTTHGNAAHDPDFATEAALVAHEADDSNPHGVTAGQAGADPAGSAAAVAASLGDHVGEEVNGDDPHGVKAFGNAAYVRSEDIRHAVTISQEDYDELEPPDAETLYLIPEAE